MPLHSFLRARGISNYPLTGVPGNSWRRGTTTLATTEMQLKSRFRKLQSRGILLGFILALSPSLAVAIDPNFSHHPTVNGGNLYSNAASMGAIAQQIRNSTFWEILDAKPRQNNGKLLYRFKLINKSGKVMILNVNPRQPNLKKLVQ